ncbi:MAG: 3-hydroxyacyl-CoA dehydrogenase NAD-binding domain-containing protein [Terracidiphilus sp.]
MPETVAIIGAGPLGRWLALAAARAGFRVQLEDVMPANLHHAQELLRRQLSPQPLSEATPALKGHDFSRAANATRQSRALATDNELRSEGGGGFNPRKRLREPEGASAPERGVKGTGFSPYIEPTILEGALAPEGTLPVAFVSTIEDAVRNADLVIDCVPDELESKLEILLLLDRMAPPRTVLATPTTRHSIADLASCTYRPSKCVAIVAEANTLTENPNAGAAREILLRTTAQTAPETVALLDRFWRQLGFIPHFDQDPAT